MVRVGKVGQGNSGGSGKGNKAGSGEEVSLDLFLSRGGFDLHFGLNGPNVGLSVLIDGNSSLNDRSTGLVFGEKSGGLGGGLGRS